MRESELGVCRKLRMERVWAVVLVLVLAVAELPETSGCLEKERLGWMELGKAMALGQLPALLGESDCCSWNGVHCSATTGRVQSLTFSPADLKYSGYHLNISLLIPFEELELLKLESCYLDGLINQADLMKMTRLETLSFASNNLTNTVSLQDFANMKNLKYLGLSNNSLTGIDLEGTCEMKNIVALDLSYNNITSHLPPCIGNLTHLQILNISSNQIIGNIPSTIGKLSHLSVLFLDRNYFSDSFSLHILANNSRLERLYLSNMYTDFQVETETQSWVPSFKLSHLDLSGSNLNKMSGSVIPNFLLYQSQLNLISLSHNKLRDTFPSWLLQNNSKLFSLQMENNFLIGNLVLPNFTHSLMAFTVSKNRVGGKLLDDLQLFLPALVIIDLSSNSFSGKIPKTLFGNNSNSLMFVDFSNNLLDGEICLNLTTLPSLMFLDLSNNKFNGSIEELTSSPSLSILDVSNNLISGKLPKSLFGNNSNSLRIVQFSNNLLDGEICLNLTTLPSLMLLDLSNNKFNGSIEELTFSPSLSTLDVSNNLISGKLPKFLGNFSSISTLVVSNNSFDGEIPDVLCRIPTLSYLDISYNKFSGSIPFCFRTSSIEYLYMQKCSLFGVIPRGLFLKSTLITLDLSYNNFSRSVLPNWIYRQHNLQALIMAGLQLEGEISTQLCGLENIRIMDLSHNNFNGSIPSCLFRRPFWVAKDRESHAFNLIPSRKISFKVEFTTKGMHVIYEGVPLDLMNGLDVSNNKLSGQIPAEIGDSEAIKALNLSNNQLSGSIPSSISKLRSIESLDLSSNTLSGRIPPEMVHLTFLSTFKVSNNNLSGSIPTGGQFLNFDEQNFVGNQFECQPYLDRHCPTHSSLPRTPPDERDKDDETIFERTFFWWSFSAAYVTVVISLVVLVGIDTHFSRVWFATVNAVCSKLVCVFVKMKFILGLK